MHASPDPRHAEPRPAPRPPQELRTFFASLLGASRGTDPIIESGNKYGKTDVSHRMNGELLMHECKASERVKALTAADRWVLPLPLTLPLIRRSSTPSRSRSRHPSAHPHPHSHQGAHGGDP